MNRTENVQPSTAGLMDRPCTNGLRILHHQSLAQEKISRSGVEKQVHLVVKNTPFLIQVGFNREGLPLSFGNYKVEAKLLYDHNNNKEVDFVRVKPLLYKMHINDRGDEITIEARIKVLTSQLEDMFFRIYVIAADAKDPHGQPFTALTEPIKVISKPDQVKRKTTVPNSAAPSAKLDKKSLKDVFGDTLSRLERRQEEQGKLLDMILKNQMLLMQWMQQQQQQQHVHHQYAAAASSPRPTSPTSGSGVPLGHPYIGHPMELPHPQQALTNGMTSAMSVTTIAPPIGQSQMPPISVHGNGSSSSSSPASSPAGAGSSGLVMSGPRVGDKRKVSVMDFDETLGELATAYRSLAPDQRPTKIRRVLDTCTSEELDEVHELFELFNSEDIKKAFPPGFGGFMGGPPSPSGVIASGGAVGGHHGSHGGWNGPATPHSSGYGASQPYGAAYAPGTGPHEFHDFFSI